MGARTSGNGTVLSRFASTIRNWKRSGNAASPSAMNSRRKKSLTTAAQPGWKRCGNWPTAFAPAPPDTKERRFETAGAEERRFQIAARGSWFAITCRDKAEALLVVGIVQ